LKNVGKEKKIFPLFFEVVFRNIAQQKEALIQKRFEEPCMILIRYGCKE